jgi:putative glutamine amidotransferase
MNMLKGLLVLFVISLLWSCERPQEKKLILISKDYNGHIQGWMKDLNPENTLRVFYEIPKDSMQFFLKKADAMIIGGGRDIHPTIYDKPDYVEVCGEFDRFRDSIEILMIHYAMTNKVPVLGICRGHQILNAANGGSLIPDIPSFIPESELQHRSDSVDAHEIEMLENTWLSKLMPEKKYMVNSRHHQCVDKVAPNFVVAARSADGVIESIEIQDKNIHPFAKGVQWHPESLRNELSMSIGKLFLEQLEE